MNIKGIIGLSVVCAAEVVMGAPDMDVTTVTMSQDIPTRLVTINYTLSDQPAVITLDIETNIVVNGETIGWASIGGEHVCNATGDVWKKIEKTTGVITWRPDQSWEGPDGKGFKVDGVTYKARAKVTAYAMNNTPDYMVVDVSDAAQPNTQKYYPSVDFLPGGILSNTNYRATKLVMRKIMAKDVEWTMGSVAETGRQTNREATHQVKLTNNYYIGVFELTQAQWVLITGYNPSKFSEGENAMRPVENVNYNEIRLYSNSTVAATDEQIAQYSWPKDPNPSSFLGKIRAKTGIDFDLPSEAQWEFAARAGHGEGYWGDGSAIKISSSNMDANLNRLGRYLNNPSTNSSKNPSVTIAPVEGGTAIVGSYEQNGWGLYDSHGNVWEWCLDWDEADIAGHGGKVNIDQNNPKFTLSGEEGDRRILRSGSWAGTAQQSRSAYRNQSVPSTRFSSGLRLSCTAGLQ